MKLMVVVALFAASIQSASAQCYYCAPMPSISPSIVQGPSMPGAGYAPMPPPSYSPPPFTAPVPPPPPPPPIVAVSPLGQPMGVVVPYGNMGVVVSPDGQPQSVIVPFD